MCRSLFVVSLLYSTLLSLNHVEYRSKETAQLRNFKDIIQSLVLVAFVKLNASSEFRSYFL